MIVGNNEVVIDIQIEELEQIQAPHLVWGD